MKKITIFYLIDLIWIMVFAGLSFIENNSADKGLGAIESLGRFYIYLGLCVLGIVIFFIVWFIKKISKKDIK